MLQLAVLPAAIWEAQVSDPLLGHGYDERAPLVLVLDTSQSMARPEQAPRIAELNAALRQWLDDAKARTSVRVALEVAIVTFGSAVSVVDPATGEPGDPAAADPATAFAPVDQVSAPALHAAGFTPMLPAIDVALDLAVRRRQLLKERGVPSRRPMLWLLTDGAPTDADGQPLEISDLAPAAGRLRAAERAADPDQSCRFFAIGVGDADRELLQALAPQSTMMLSGFPFRDILGIVSDSAENVRSSAQPEDDYLQVGKIADFAEKLRDFEAGQLEERG
jgi:uncharacterized protein YegL